MEWETKPGVADCGLGVLACPCESSAAVMCRWLGTYAGEASLLRWRPIPYALR